MEIGTLVRGDRPWDESALSGTICAAPVLTIREKDAVRIRFVSRARAKHRFWTPVQKLGP